MVEGGARGVKRAASSSSSPQERVTTIVRLLLARDGQRQTDLAAGLGVDASMISRSMQGARSWQLDDLYAMAEFFGEPVTIFHDDPDELFELFRREV